MSLLAKTIQIHQAIYENTNGWLGHRMLGVPTLLLRTTGRRTGNERTSALVYIEDNGRYIVVPSNGGAPKPPAWLLNIQSKRDVAIQIGRRRSSATATVIERGDAEYERLWQAVNEANSGRYDQYQSKTDRPIPLVALTPG